VVVEKIDRVPGGKGGNVSVAASRILGPGRVALLACVGSDEVGKKQIAILKLEGVDTTAVQSLDRLESGQAYITVDEKGSNVIETHFGANAGLKREHLMLPQVQSMFASTRMLVVIDPPRHVACYRQSSLFSQTSACSSSSTPHDMLRENCSQRVVDWEGQ